MFLQKTFQYTVGFVELKVEGYFVERFVNLCLHRNIEIWDVTRKYDGVIFFKIHEYDFKKMGEIAEITKSQVSIVKREGIPHMVALYQKRKIFVLIFLTILIVMYIASQRIWMIQIKGDFSIPLEEVEAELREENIIVGMDKKDLDFDIAKRNIYLRRNDILWIGFEIKGVKLNVEVLERTAPKTDDLMGEPCDIVAEKAGIVTKILVREGTKMKKVGDVVSKGDILVSGMVKSNYSANRAVHANAEIEIKTWYTGKIAVPYQRSLVAKSGNLEKKYIIKIGNYTINLLNTSTKFEKYDTISNVNKLTLFGKFEFPIAVETITYEEFIADDIHYSKEEALELAKEEALILAKQEIPSTAQVLNSEYKTFYTEEEVIVRATVECIESIGTKKKVLDSND